MYVGYCEKEPRPIPLSKRIHRGMDIVHDRCGNEIYITDERWEHMHKRHPEISGYEEHVLRALRSGRRKQQPLELDIFKYSRPYDDLPKPHKQVIVVVKFGEKIDEQGQVEPNNFVLTAYMK